MGAGACRCPEIAGYWIDKRSFNKSSTPGGAGPPAPGRRSAMSVAPYRFVVPDAWCDYNRHFSDGCFLLAFSTAADGVLQAAGLGAPYRARSGCSVYTVEAAVRYHREGKAGDALEIRQGVRAHDDKRLWAWQEMFRGEDLLAGCECLYLHVDATGPKVVPFPAEVVARIAALEAAAPAPAMAASRLRAPGA
jgi:acyl-CoA thioester hydrolase